MSPRTSDLLFLYGVMPPLLAAMLFALVSLFVGMWVTGGWIWNLIF